MQVRLKNSHGIFKPLLQAVDSSLRRSSVKRFVLETTGNVTNQTLAAVAAGDISFAGAVPADLITGGSHHDDATRVTVASWCHINARAKIRWLMDYSLLLDAIYDIIDLFLFKQEKFLYIP